ncbi:MAG TPA: hypothetical protein VGM51_14405 [Armatimonadota bacterium]
MKITRMPVLPRRLRRAIPWLAAIALGTWPLMEDILPARGAPTQNNAATRLPLVVLGYNELGMHCMNQDFSELCILPPFNTMHAQVIDRTAEHPQIVSSGITLNYSIPGNTRSYDKTNFWTYAQALFGTAFPKDYGLAGTTLTGTMTVDATGQWGATGIPLTPMTDAGKLDPYQLARLVATQNGVVVGRTQPVIPVSWEISCNICHKTPGISAATDILRAHDRRHGTTLESEKPVLCARCHADPALGAAGTTGVSTLSHAMHSAHASRMTAANLKVDCYACHPGIRTQCQRDIHLAKGMDCHNCHGDMVQVGDVNRTPWVSEPHCSDCHNVAGHAYEEPRLLFKQSRGHNGVHCPACHGAPHAITPTTTSADNVQAMAIQGHTGTINTCTVCHSTQPGDPFNHTLGDG